MCRALCEVGNKKVSALFDARCNHEILADVYKILIDQLWDRIFIEKLKNHTEEYVDDEWPCIMYPDRCDQIFGLKLYKFEFVFQT